MKLVKDYIDEKTVYYWISSPESQEIISPQFRTFAQADEWGKEQQFSQLDAPVRRRDKRSSERRYAESDISSASSSQTISQMATKLDFDWHKEKADG